MGIAADFVLVVLAGFCGGLIARLLRLPLLVGYVLAGIFVGPNTAGPTVAQTHEIELLAEIGVALLLFSIGLEVSLRDLQPVRRIAIVGGIIQILIVSFVVAVVAPGALKVSHIEAIWLGAMFSLSSTMVVIKILTSTGLTSTLASRVMIGLLVVQDLSVIPMLTILPQLGSNDNLFLSLGRAILTAMLIIGVMVLLGARLLPKLLKRVLAWGSRELFLISVVAVAVGVGYATYSAGMSFALGAFIAGLVLSESEFSHQALSDVVPLRDIFGLLFFVSVGMLFDPTYAATQVTQIAFTVMLILVGKSVLIGGLARLFGYYNMAPWIVGLGLCQIGEFSFVLARVGLGSGALSRETYNLALTCTIITMALSPIMSKAALPLGRLWRKLGKNTTPSRIFKLPEESKSGHVIIAGYGHSGQAAVRALESTGLELVVVELNHLVFENIETDGLSAVWGDVGREEILQAAQVDGARVLLLTIPNENVIRLTVEKARQQNPELVIVARAGRKEQILALRQLGVDIVVQPEFEGGVEIVRQVLMRCNYDYDTAQRVVFDLRQKLYGRKE